MTIEQRIIAVLAALKGADGKALFGQVAGLAAFARAQAGMVSAQRRDVFVVREQRRPAQSSPVPADLVLRQTYGVYLALGNTAEQAAQTLPGVERAILASLHGLDLGDGAEPLCYDQDAPQQAESALLWWRFEFSTDYAFDARAAAAPALAQLTDTDPSTGN